MNLPPLPSTRLGQNIYSTGGDPIWHPLYTEASMLEYGELCRKQAMKENAKLRDMLSKAVQRQGFSNAELIAAREALREEQE